MGNSVHNNLCVQEKPSDLRTEIEHEVLEAYREAEARQKTEQQLPQPSLPRVRAK